MFHSSIVALVTPMKKNGDVDVESLRRLTEMHITQGTQGIVVAGSTGEAATLNTQEKVMIFKHVEEQTAGRVPVIAGTGTYATRETIELSQKAMDVGVDACLIVTPYYNKPTQEGLYQHYKLIAEKLPIPIILYNVPGRTACDMLPETVERLAAFSNIVAIKESTNKLERIQELLKRCGDRLSILSGEDAPTLDYMLAGAKGVISVTANVAPKLMAEMCKDAQENRIAEAKAINEKLMPLHKNLFVESNPIPVKWVLHELGLIPEGIRLPLTPLSEKFHDTLRSALQHAGLTKKSYA